MTATQRKPAHSSDCFICQDAQSLYNRSHDRVPVRVKLCVEHDNPAECPECGAVEDSQCFDVLGATNDRLFCNDCGREVLAKAPRIRRGQRFIWSKPGKTERPKPLEMRVKKLPTPIAGCKWAVQVRGDGSGRWITASVFKTKTEALQAMHDEREN